MIGMNRSLLWAALAGCLLAGCSDDAKKSHRAEQASLSRMLYSPNGEPLNGGNLGRPTCAVALSGWFDRVDSNHDGTISREEFITDAQAQFQRMDTDHNNYLVSEEIERFRQPYRQQVSVESAPAKPHAPSQEGGRHGHTKGGHKEEDHEQDDAGDNTADPVMSADTNLDFKVTQDEFIAYSQKQFLTLNATHDGKLSRDEVLARCESK